MGLIQEFFAKIGDAIDGLLSKITDSVIIKSMIKVGFFFLLIIIIIIAFVGCSHRTTTYTYENFLSKMVSMATTKYKKSDKLPQEDGEQLIVDIKEFVEDGTIKDLSKVIKNGEKCSGNIKIINNNGYYLYIPSLDCGEDYKSVTLYEKIVNEDNIVTQGNGLYLSNGSYIFKGDKVNNYVDLRGIKYRIVRVNDDGTIRALNTTKVEKISWDDRYNVDKKSTYGINNYYLNGINSRIKDYIEKYYQELPNDIKPYYANQEICVGKRNSQDNIFDTSIECSEKIDNYPLSLMYPYEYYLASLDPNCIAYGNPSCANYNYFNGIGSMWTITADSKNTYNVFKITTSGVVTSRASSVVQPKTVVRLNGDIIVESGDGSKENPYVIKTFISNKKR